MENRLKKILLIPIIAIFLILVVSAILAPVLEEHQLIISQDFFSILREVCHQLPTRCFWIYQRPMGLCSRCFGLYLGIAITGIFLIFTSKDTMKIRFTLYLAAPIIIEPLIESLGVWNANNFIRFSTGILAGIGCAYLYLSIIKKLSSIGRQKREQNS